MSSAVENLIKYFMTVVAAAAICWKALDSWQKRKSAPIREMEAKIKVLESDVVEIKVKAKDTLEIVLSYFKK